MAPTTETITADLVRKAPPTTPASVDPEPTRSPVPDCFRKLGVRVELIRGTFVRAEVYGEFDVRTAAEARLEKHTDEELPARDNPNDGICSFLVRLRIAEDRSSWEASAEFRAVEGDLDGLAKIAKPAGGPSTGLNILGAVSALSPLLAAATPPSPTAGELVPMVVVGGGAVALGTTGRLQTQYVILRGGTLMVTNGLVDPATGSGPTTTQVSVLLDVETAFSFDLKYVKVDPGQADRRALQGRRRPQQLGQPAPAGRHGRVRAAARLRPQQGLHARRPGRLHGGRAAARLDPARARRPGEPDEPDVPRGRGGTRRRPGHRQRRHGARAATPRRGRGCRR